MLTLGASDELRQSWRLIDQEAWTNPGVYERRVAATSIHALYALLVRPGGMIGLALDLPSKEAAAIDEDAARGFVLRKTWNQETGRLRLSVMLSERRYLDVFEVLACDVIEKIAKCGTVEAGGASLRDRLAHWKRFLKAAGEEGLSADEQTGLFGELFVLRALVATGACEPSRILTAWQGPASANQDFHCRGQAIEVKATAANDVSRICIANERQLDEDGLKALFLCHVAFDKRAGAGQTLPALISSLLLAFGDSLRDDFLDRLALAGYSEVHQTRYQVHGYECRVLRVYRVDKDFPRIKQAELRTGVGDVTYFASLSNIPPLSETVEYLAREVFAAETEQT
jgi:hypothetical protein